MTYAFRDNTFFATLKENKFDRIDIEIGDSKQTKVFHPQVKLMRWDNEVNLSLRVIHDEKTPQITSTDDKISWRGEKLESHFYGLKRKSHDISNSIRKIHLGNIRPERMSATFDLFKVLKQDRITALIYSPNKETYMFYGMYGREWDFYPDKLNNRLLVRYGVETGATNTMFIDTNSVFVDIYSPNGVKYTTEEKFVESVLETVREYGYAGEIKRVDTRLFFTKEGVDKKFLSWAYSDGHLFLYYSLEAPAYDFRQAFKPETRTMYQYGGIREIIIDDGLFADRIIAKLSARLNLQVEANGLLPEEIKILDELESAYSQKEWIEWANTEYYIPSELDEDGEYEFDVLLKEKPITNSIAFTISSKGIEFRYQPELTHEEKNRGCYRPQHAIGSYAVYYKNCPLNYQGGKLYRMGKLCHIFRPRIFDSSGKSCWGCLTIDTSSNILTVTIPQQFLDAAVYPIRHSAGLDIGMKGVSSSAYITNSNIYLSKWKGAAGTGVSMSMYLACVARAKHMAVYFIDYSTEPPLFILIDNGSTGEDSSEYIVAWCTINFTNNPIISAVNYAFAEQYSQSKISWTIYYDTGGDGKGSYATTYNSTFPSTLSNVNISGTESYSIYLTYTPGAAVVKKPPHGSAVGDPHII